MIFKDNFNVGSVLVWKVNDGNFVGYKVVDYILQDVDGVSTRLWILRRGSVRDDRFEFDSEAQRRFIIKTTGQVRALGFEMTWTPPKGFQDGEFLTDSEGHVFYHENKNTVWRLDTVGDWLGVAHSSLSARVKQFGELSVLKTASDRPFSEVVK